MKLLFYVFLEVCCFVVKFVFVERLVEVLGFVDYLLFWGFEGLYFVCCLCCVFLYLLRKGVLWIYFLWGCRFLDVVKEFVGFDCVFVWWSEVNWFWFLFIVVIIGWDELLFVMVVDGLKFYDVELCEVFFWVFWIIFDVWFWEVYWFVLVFSVFEF